MLNLSINEQKEILGGYWQIKYFNKYGNCISSVGYYSNQNDAAKAAQKNPLPKGAVSYTTIER